MIGAMALASAACIIVAFIPTDKGQGNLFQFYFLGSFQPCNVIR